MTFAALGFWLCFLGILYTYLLYPLWLSIWPRFWARPVARAKIALPVSVVVAAYNEQRTIAARVRELLAQIERAGVVGEVIVLSDGSTDATAWEARAACSDERVVVVELPVNGGKAAALSHGASLAQYNVLVFADARQTWAPDALSRLLENFADPSIGAVSGDLVIETHPGIMAGVGFYWHLEKWMRKQEGRVHSCVGVTGAICAVRSSLFSPVPQGTLIDDVYWPLVVAMGGARVVHDSHAIAYDRLPDRTRDEFRRKVRTLTGNFQLLTLLPTAFTPLKNPICFQLMSHKMLRLLVPWLMLLMLVLSLVPEEPFYRTAFIGQCLFYTSGILGVVVGRRLGHWLRPASLVASFLVLNAAAWVAFWVWVSGRTTRAWSKVAYGPAPSRVGHDHVVSVARP